MTARTPLLRRAARRLTWQPSGCWTWGGALNREGYGVIGDGKRTYLVHRALYERLVEPIPAGLHLDHLCRVRSCANVRHLEPVTPRVNVLRSEGPRLTKEREHPTECPAGHAYDEANTHIDVRGCRNCRTCRRERARAARSAT